MLPNGTLHPQAQQVLDALKADLGLNYLRQMVQRDPQRVLPAVIQSLGQAHLQAFQSDNRLAGEIEKLLFEPPEISEQSERSPEEQRHLLQQHARTALGLNLRQLQAVLDLEALGFPYDQALDAYIACDKNQELAANFLLECQFQEPELPSSPSHATQSPLFNQGQHVMQSPHFNQGHHSMQSPHFNQRQQGYTGTQGLQPQAFHSGQAPLYHGGVQQFSPQMTIDMPIGAPQMGQMGQMGYGGQQVQFMQMPQPEVSSSNVALTMDEWEAVKRLMELGFDKEASLRAYVQANKNENEAAGMLFGD